MHLVAGSMNTFPAVTVNVTKRPAQTFHYLLTTSDIFAELKVKVSLNAEHGPSRAGPKALQWQNFRPD